MMATFYRKVTNFSCSLPPFCRMCHELVNFVSFKMNCGTMEENCGIMLQHDAIILQKCANMLQNSGAMQSHSLENEYHDGSVKRQCLILKQQSVTRLQYFAASWKRAGVNYSNAVVWVLNDDDLLRVIAVIESNLVITEERIVKP